MAKQSRAKKYVIEYVPYTTPDGRKPQQELADAIANGARVVLFLGGIRSGKTYSGVAECLKQVYLYKKKPNLGWIISPTYLMSLVTERIFRKLCQTPAGSLILSERRGERAFYLRPAPGDTEPFRIEFKTAEDPDKLRGASIAFALLDEAAMMKAEVMDIIQGRVLDSRGLILATTTPRGKNWVFHELAVRADWDPKYVLIRAKTSENTYLDPAEVAEKYAKYASKSDTLAKQEMDAQFCEFEGLVFRHFSPEHICKEFAIPEGTPLICGIDWGYNDPFVCLFLAHYEGVWYLVDEYYQTRTLLDDHAAFLKNHRLWPDVVRAWADPNGAGSQNIKEFAARGVRCFRARRPDEANRTVGWPELRARELNRLFSSRLKSPFDKTQVPGLNFFPHIIHTRNEVEALCFRRLASKVEDPHSRRVSLRVVDASGREIDQNAGEVIQDKDNHCVDALGYALYSEQKLNPSAAAHYEGPSGHVIKQGKISPEEVVSQWYDEQEAEIKRRHQVAEMRPWDTLSP